MGLLAIVLSWLLAAPNPSSVEPDDPLSVRVAAIEFRGDLPEPWTRALQTDLAEGIVRGGLHVQSGDGAAAHVVETVIRHEARDYTVELTLRSVSAPPLQASEQCSVCGLDEVAGLVSDLAATLSARAASPRGRDPVLQVRSSPSAASVHVDGRLMGQTPLRVVVEPGIHHVVVHAPRFVDVERRVEAQPSVTETLDVTLLVDPRHGRRRRIAGAVLVAAGAATFAGSVAPLVLHDRPYRRRCDGEDIDASGTCRFRHDTLALGVSMAASGLVAAAVGAVLWGQAAKRARPRRAKAARRTYAGRRDP